MTLLLMTDEEDEDLAHQDVPAMSSPPGQFTFLYCLPVNNNDLCTVSPRQPLNDSEDEDLQITRTPARKNAGGNSVSREPVQYAPILFHHSLKLLVPQTKLLLLHSLLHQLAQCPPKGPQKRKGGLGQLQVPRKQFLKISHQDPRLEQRGLLVISESGQQQKKDSQEMMTKWKWF